MFRFIATLACVALAATVNPALGQLFETKAPQAFMIAAETGSVLFSKNPDEPFPPASLAKLMTLEVVFNELKSGRLSLEDEFFVSENAWRTGGAPSGTATMFAELESSVPLEALIRGIVVQSANDGCIIIAEGMAGSEANFAQIMTERARALGLEVSTFVNSTGLPAEGQQVTVRELTTLSLHLWREYPEYYHYFAEPDFEWNGIRQRNRNPLLPLNLGADGLKTGHTEASGYGIAASAERAGRRLFAALGGMTSEAERAEETRKLLDWGMRAFDEHELFAAGESLGEGRVYGGEKGTVALRANGSLSILVPNTNPGRLSARIVYDGPIPAPVEEGTQIGTLQIRIDDTLSQETPLFAAETVGTGALHQRAMGAVRELLIGWMR